MEIVEEGGLVRDLMDVLKGGPARARADIEDVIAIDADDAIQRRSLELFGALSRESGDDTALRAGAVAITKQRKPTAVLPSLAIRLASLQPAGGRLGGLCRGRVRWPRVSVDARPPPVPGPAWPQTSTPPVRSTIWLPSVPAPLQGSHIGRPRSRAPSADSLSGTAHYTGQRYSAG